ncbi:GNAT family N-acetyltransferase [Herpetosiphon gulosus]|uniref:Mycothiol acetyltransferase n=1 Tax=Herpetosiphon gulosus TaxID=1973496 RepID=A0ABP9X0R5_9CHLR
MQAVAQYLKRPATLDDIPAATALINRCSIEEANVIEIDEAELGVEWQDSHFNLATDSLTIWDGETLIGVVGVFSDEPYVHGYGWTRVHSDYAADNIQPQLLDWLDQRVSQNIAKAPSDAAVSIYHSALSTNHVVAQNLSNHGYNLVRHFWRMVIELADYTPQPVQLPEGLIIRPYDPATELPALIHAVRDSFRDHWGYVESPFEQDLKQWQEMIAREPNYDPSLFFIACDGDQIAGVAMCWKHITEDPKMGWVGTLGVCRPWRRKGLAKALLYHAFNEFSNRGQARVGLAVDSSSLTGATKVYADVGMKPVRQFDRYQKVLRPGIELGTETAEA